MFTFNNSTGAYEEVTNTNANTLQVGQAYALFVRGDRTIDLTNNSAEPNVTRLKANGALHIGDYPGSPEQINTSADGYSLIANPYQAIVDFNAITFAGDVNANSFYMFNPTSTVDNPFGTFESIDATTEPANAMIQPGQSFFVQNLSTVTTNPTVQFTEAAKKTDGNLTTVFSDPSIALANLHLYNASNESVDVIKFRFQHEANNGIDEYDSRKFSNQVLNFASVSNNELLAIDRRDIPDTNDIIPLFIENYQGNQYEFRVNIENWDNNIDMYVVDSYLNTSTLIHNNQPYAFVVDATVPESMASDRFSLSFDNSTLNTQDQVFDATFRLYPNPADNGVFNIQFSTFNNDNINLKLYNILGQNVFTQNVMMDGSGKASVDVSQLSSGVYLVEIIQNEIKLIRKLVID
jgi:hypothetical protein